MPHVELVASGVLVLAFAATVPVVLGFEHGRRLVWTVLIASLPLLWVVGGFHLWRRLCPLAAASRLPAALGRGGKRRAGEWLGRNAPALQLGLMVLALSLRLIGANGSPWALAALLVVVTLAAITIGATYTGKTWCNFVCPVGLVEKLYTEPARLLPGRSSQCDPCSACKKNCPDIDPEPGYWKELELPARRLAYAAWPGVVLGFCVYYYLRAGTWDAYFSGAWAYEDGQAASALGPGLFFAPGVPRVLAAPLVLIGSGMASAALFFVAHRLATARACAREPERATAVRRRVTHRAYALAGFLAFNIFYGFAGQPTLLRAPLWLQRLLSATVVAASTLLLVRRWTRDEADAPREKLARRLLGTWSWEDAAVAHSLDVLPALHAERTRERERRLAAYRAAVEEVATDGVLTEAEGALLARLRASLRVDDAEHARILREVTVDRPPGLASAEVRLQREQYAGRLQLLVEVAARSGAGLDEAAVDRLREDHGVDRTTHAELLADLRAPGGVTGRQVMDEVQGIATLAAGGRAGSALAPLHATFLGWVVRARVDERLGRVAELLHAAGFEGQACERLRGLTQQAPAERTSTLAAFDAGGLALALEQLTSALAGPAVTAEPGPPDADTAAKLLADRSPYVRAAAVLALGTVPGGRHEAAANDPHPLVREAVALAAGGRDARTRLVNDNDPEVHAAAAGSSSTRLVRLRDLHAVEWLSTLGPGELEPWAQAAAPCVLEDQSALCQEGDLGAPVAVLLDGRVRVTVRDAAGGDRLLRECGPGAVLGEILALEGGPCSATVRAVGRVEALRLPALTFRTLIERQPQVAVAIASQLARRLRTLPVT